MNLPMCKYVSEKGDTRKGATGGLTEAVREFGAFFPVGNAVSGVPPLLAIAERHRGRSLQGFQFPDALGLPTYAILALLLLSVFPVRQTLFAQEQNSESTEEAELPKLADMKVPSAEDLVKKPPVAWIVLNNEDVIVSEPVYPRPNTKAQLHQRFEESKKWPKPLNDEQRQQQRDQRDRLKFVEVVLPAEGETESPEYQLPVYQIKTIIHHEDLILRRVALLRGEEKYRDAFEMLFSLSQKYPQWPGLGEEQNHLVFAEAITKQNDGRPYPALVLLEQLHEANPKYPGLKTRLGNIADRLIADAHQAKEYRRTRHFLGRLSQKEPRHDIAVKWINSLTAEATALLNAARRAAENGQHDLAAVTVAEAAKIWPGTPGLQEPHARFTARFQKLKVGVLRLAHEKSSYPLPSPAQEREKKLTQTKLFEFSHVDKIPHYRSLFFEQWVPTDLGRQAVFTMRQNRPYWEAHPEVTAPSAGNGGRVRRQPFQVPLQRRPAVGWSMPGPVRPVTVVKAARLNCGSPRLLSGTVRSFRVAVRPRPVRFHRVRPVHRRSNGDHWNRSVSRT